jgi:small subunit ribosomal protein S3
LGQKVHPTGFRLGVIEGWQSRWYARRDYKDLLAEDRVIRGLVNKRLANAAVSKVEIERVAGNVSVTVHTAKPGIVIGRNGEAVERLRVELEAAINKGVEAKAKKKVRLSIHEIRNPEVDAFLVARSIAEQLEKRVAFRRAMKQAVQKAMRGNAKGIKVVAGGRLGGAEIARVEKEVEGSVPLQTLRANIDYGLAEAHTTYGVIGVKVWIYHGDILPEKARERGLGAAQQRSSQVSLEGDRGPRRDGDRGPRRDDRGPRRDDRGPRRDDRGGFQGGRGGPGGPRRDDRGPRPGGPRAGGTGSGTGIASRPAPRPRPAAPAPPAEAAAPTPAETTAPAVEETIPMETTPTQQPQAESSEE